METTGKVRRDHFVHGKSIKQISRDRGISRNSVRKILRSGETGSRYERCDIPMPKLGAFVAQLDAMLEANEKRGKNILFFGGSMGEEVIEETLGLTNTPA